MFSVHTVCHNSHWNALIVEMGGGRVDDGHRGPRSAPFCVLISLKIQIRTAHGGVAWIKTTSSKYLSIETHVIALVATVLLRPA